jgi:ABC-type multidrug transport system fused ATPase/permease subunit
MKKIKLFFINLGLVSRATSTSKKKLKIFISIILTNFIVFSDIIIILFVSSFFTELVVPEFLNAIGIFENNLLFPIFVLLRFLCIYIDKVNIFGLQFEIEKNLRKYMIRQIFNKGNYSISDTYYFVNTISVQVAAFFKTLANLLSSGLQVIIFTSYLLFTNREIINYYFFGVLVLIFPTLYLTKLARKYAHVSYHFGDKVSGEIESVIENLFLIKILKKSLKEVQNFSFFLIEYYDSKLNDIKAGTLNILLPNFITIFAISLFLVSTENFFLLKLELIGVLIRLFQSISTLNSNLHLVSAFHVYNEKYLDFVEDGKIQYSENFEIRESSDENIIEIKNVSFKYFGSDNYLFKKLDLNIKRNKHYVIVGSNGSGKSTLLGLASGVLYAQEGKVSCASKKIGYVSSTPMIFKKSIRENIMYGNEEENISDSEMLNQLENFKVFTDSRALNLNEVISNKSLSSGQMQKISFVRAILGNVDLLILDESTANLDKETKQIIYNNLKNLDITILNSTHDLSEIGIFDYTIEIRNIDDNRELLIN